MCLGRWEWGARQENGLQAKEFKLYFEGKIKERSFLSGKINLDSLGKVENETGLPRVSKRVEAFS